MDDNVISTSRPQAGLLEAVRINGTGWWEALSGGCGHVDSATPVVLGMGRCPGLSNVELTAHRQRSVIYAYSALAGVTIEVIDCCVIQTCICLHCHETIIV